MSRIRESDERGGFDGEDSACARDSGQSVEDWQTSAKATLSSSLRRVVSGIWTCLGRG